MRHSRSCERSMLLRSIYSAASPCAVPTSHPLHSRFQIVAPSLTSAEALEDFLVNFMEVEQDDSGKSVITPKYMTQLVSGGACRGSRGASCGDAPSAPSCLDAGPPPPHCMRDTSHSLLKPKHGARPLFLLFPMASECAGHRAPLLAAASASPPSAPASSRPRPRHAPFPFPARHRQPAAHHPGGVPGRPGAVQQGPGAGDAGGAQHAAVPDAVGRGGGQPHARALRGRPARGCV